MVLRFFLLAITFLFVSCTDVQRDNPYDPDGINYIGASSSSAVMYLSSSKPSSSSSITFMYCVYETFCADGPFATCQGSGVLSNTCPSSSGSFVVIPSSSSATPVAPSSSSVVSSSSSLPIQTVVNYGPSITYQGETYQTVVIGTQTWFKRNLNYAAEGSKCYGDNTGGDRQNRCATYGRLYDWATANTVCPKGWHLPSKDEWDALSSYIQSDKGCTNCDAKHLKSTSGWYNNGNGLDSYGFSALPGGDGYDYFLSVGNDGYWWSSSEYDSDSEYDFAYNKHIGFSGEYVGCSYEEKIFLYSVRCVQD